MMSLISCFSCPLCIIVSVNRYVCMFNNQIYRLPGQVNLIILATLMIKDVSWHTLDVYLNLELAHHSMQLLLVSSTGVAAA